MVKLRAVFPSFLLALCLACALVPISAFAQAGDITSVDASSNEPNQQRVNDENEPEQDGLADESFDTSSDSTQREGAVTNLPGMVAVEQIVSEGSAIVPFGATDDATLRNDIAAAAPGGVVEIDSDVTIAAIPLSITKNLTLKATSGTVRLFVTGNYRHITTSAGISLALEGVEIIGNAPTLGGGISSPGNLTLTGAVVKQCAAAQGGAVSASIAFTMIDGELSGNSATGSGGAVYSGGTFTLQSGLITGNKAGLDGGGVHTFSPAFLNGGTLSNNEADQDGGGIYAMTVEANGTTISGNTAVEQGGGAFFENGVMYDGQITGNTAGMNGGGLHGEQSIEIRGGEISANRADNGGGMSSLGTTQIIDGAIFGNIAVTNGGGVYAYNTTVTGGSITDNTAANNGGGFYLSGVLSLTDAHVDYNTATAGSGGGLWIAGSFTVFSGTVDGNTAGINGGGIYCPAVLAMLLGGSISKNFAGQDGGGLYVQGINADGTTISGNRAEESGGGFFSQQDTVHSGIISNNSAGISGGAIHGEGDIEINGGEITGNTAPNGGGLESLSEVDFNAGLLARNVAEQDGGGIYGILANITVGPTAVFADNSASRAYQILPADIALYNSRVFTTAITVPFTYAYNNYDINYTGDEALYRVEFDSQGGTSVGTVFVPENSLIVKPAGPTREGYEFTGWFTDAAATVPWDFATGTVTANMILYAGWKEIVPAPPVNPPDGGNGANGTGGTKGLAKTGDGFPFGVETYAALALAGAVSLAAFGVRSKRGKKR